MFPSVRPRNADGEKGFSLLEVLVAIVVLSVGLISAALLMANVYKATVRSRYMALAAQLASEELEDLSRWPANMNSSPPYIDPHILVPAGSNTCGIVGETCIGMLTQDCSSTSSPITCGNNPNISYFDTVCISTANGQMNETYQMPCTGPPDGVGDYITLTYSPNGQAPQSPLNPALCHANPPNVGMTFDRRWVIEQDQPVVGLRRITVLVTLEDRSVGLYMKGLMANEQPPPSVTFQMSMVRP
jgi:prepilin-type N-terminal cleavage/methylation domain-containing protein